jgi:hypothetical protein
MIRIIASRAAASRQSDAAPGPSRLDCRGDRLLEQTALDLAYDERILQLPRPERHNDALSRQIGQSPALG